jgi:hypothetical protein
LATGISFRCILEIALTHAGSKQSRAAHLAGGTNMNRRKLTLTTVALFALAISLPATEAAAQQMQRVSYKTPAANSKYTVQHVLDVGDIPGHQVRLFELRRTFPTDAPTINGVKIKETISRGLSDYIDTNGSNTNYVEYVMENGDKFFSRQTTVSQSTVAADGKRKNIASGPGVITGGTGKFATIKGVVRTTNVFDAKAGINDGESDIEYTMGR